MNQKLAISLDLLRRGISVIPVLPGTETPAIEWGEYQLRPPTEEEVRKWFSEHPEWEPAAVCGNVSGGLLAIGFEGKAALKAQKLLLYLVPRLHDSWRFGAERGGLSWLGFWVRCPGLPKNFTFKEVDLSQSHHRIKAKIKFKGNGHLAVIPLDHSTKVELPKPLVNLRKEELAVLVRASMYPKPHGSLEKAAAERYLLYILFERRPRILDL